MTPAKRIFALILALLFPAAALAEADPSASRLAALGFLSERAPDMQLAVRNFQTANGMEPTGALDEATADAIGRDDAQSKAGFLEALAAKSAGGVLKSGQSGEAVVKLQGALAALGYYKGASDGMFGEGTKSAVMAFQTANGLYPSGEADQAVKFKLYEGSPVAWADFIQDKLCKKGDSGRGVRSLQRRLRALGYFDGECAASFGDRTERAVTLFQKENALPETGQADDATCRLLYSGRAKAVTDDGVLREGDAGEDVRALQFQLNRLGYFTEGVSGQFREGTLVALTFFEIASGRKPTGAADQQLIALLNRADAVPFGDAKKALAASAENVTGDALSAVAATAAQMQGKQFPTGSDELFPGFSFVQYAFAKAGVAITDPGQIVGSSGGRVFDANALSAGDIVALERPFDGGVRMLFSVYIGGGRAAYVNADTGYVVSGDLNQMEYGNAYVWNFR